MTIFLSLPAYRLPCQPELMLQVQGLSLHGVRFGCCPGYGIAVCSGPAAQRLKRASQILLMISALGGKGGGMQGRATMDELGMVNTCLLMTGKCSDSPALLLKQKCTEQICKDAKSLRLWESVDYKARSFWLRAFAEH